MSQKDYRTVKKIVFPESDFLEIHFKTDEKEYFIVKNDGKGYKWGKDHYRWNRSDGSQYEQWKRGHWKLTKNGYSLYHYKKTYKLTYPEGGVITRTYDPGYGRHFYYYEKYLESGLARNKIVNLDIYDPYNLYLCNMHFYHLKGAGKWDIGYYIKRKKIFENFFAFLNNELGISNLGIIPVQTFTDSSNYKSNAGTSLTSGGIGSWNSIFLCCGIDQYSMQVLLHELTHNVLQHHMMFLKYEKKYPYVKMPPWFNEGFADFMAAKMDAGTKKRFYRRLIKRIQSKKIPSCFSVMEQKKYQDSIPYIFGFMMVEYISKKYGNSLLKNIIEYLARGKTIKECILSETGTKAATIYNDALKYFGKISSILYTH